MLRQECETNPEKPLSIEYMQYPDCWLEKIKSYSPIEELLKIATTINLKNVNEFRGNFFQITDDLEELDQIQEMRDKGIMTLVAFQDNSNIGYISLKIHRFIEGFMKIVDEVEKR